MTAVPGVLLLAAAPPQFCSLPPVQEEAMTAKQKIKDTILDLLERYPADEITVKMISLESGYSKQPLYHNYYKRKR